MTSNTLSAHLGASGCSRKLILRLSAIHQRELMLVGLKDQEWSTPIGGDFSLMIEDRTQPQLSVSVVSSVSEDEMGMWIRLCVCTVPRYNLVDCITLERIWSVHPGAVACKLTHQVARQEHQILLRNGLASTIVLHHRNTNGVWTLALD